MFIHTLHYIRTYVHTYVRTYLHTYIHYTGVKDLIIWHVRSGEKLLSLEASSTSQMVCLVYLAWDSDSKIIAIGRGGSHSTVMLAWSPITGQKLTDVCSLEPETPRVLTVAGREINFQRDGVNAYQSWADIRSGIPDELEVLRKVVEELGKKYAVSRDGRYVAKNESFQGFVRVCDAATGCEMRVLSGHASWVGCMAWSKDGEHLVSCGLDSTLCVWTSGERVRMSTSYMCVCIHGTCVYIFVCAYMVHGVYVCIHVVCIYMVYVYDEE
jgi:WD40 repeat protein